MTLAKRPSVSIVEAGTQPLDRAKAYASAAMAPNTKRGYGSDWQAFVTWSEGKKHETLPASPETVATYLSHLADSHRKASTISRAKAAIGKIHEMAGHPNPASHPQVKVVWQGILRTIGSAQDKKTPITPKVFAAAFDSFPSTLPGIRDRALLMVGFAGAFRRSELVALNVDDVQFVDEGMRIRIVKSKTDKTGAGRVIGVPFGRKRALCPVRNLRKWLELSGVSEGPLFRAIKSNGEISKEPLCCKTVERKVKEAARAAGLKESDFAGHSLRAGLVTAAAKAGKKWHSIMNQSGHESVQTVKGYIRDATLFEDNAAEGLL